MGRLLLQAFVLLQKLVFCVCVSPHAHFVRSHTVFFPFCFEAVTCVQCDAHQKTKVACDEHTSSGHLCSLPHGKGQAKAALPAAAQPCLTLAHSI